MCLIGVAVQAGELQRMLAPERLGLCTKWAKLDRFPERQMPRRALVATAEEADWMLSRPDRRQHLQRELLFP